MRRVVYLCREGKMMFRYFKLNPSAYAVLILLMILTGCSTGSPVSPTAPTEPTRAEMSYAGERLLIGYWHIDIDPVTQEATLVPLREAGFHLNATYLMEKTPPMKIQPSVLGLDVPSNQMAVRVTLIHPDPTPLFYGFDVRGIVFTPSTYSGWNNPDLLLPLNGDSLFLRNADGYTRWWNPTEFSDNDLGLLSKYVDGKQAPAYTGSGSFNYNGTVNPYKYFITGHPDSFNIGDPFNLEDGMDLVEYFSNPDNFSNQAAIQPGSTGSRIYQFFIGPDFLTNFGFNYAIDASWALPTNPMNPTLDDFPSRAHCAEPFLLDMELEDNSLYYFDEYTNGGELSFLVRVWDWQDYSDTAFFEANTPLDDTHGALTIIGRDGFLDGSLPDVEFVSASETTRSLTYRLTFTHPTIPDFGLYDVMLIAQHSRTYPPKFVDLDDVYIASYLPMPMSVLVLPVVPEPFDLPYIDPMDLTTDDFWTVTEFHKDPPFSPVEPQPDMEDGGYYHWGLSYIEESWSSQVHFMGGEQTQDLNSYNNLMRNALISPLMTFPLSGAIKVTLEHTFSMQPFDDFGEIIFIWESGAGGTTYHPLIFNHFTGELPGNTSGIADGIRTDTFYVDSLTSFDGQDVNTFTPSPGGTFRLAFLFDSDEDVSSTYLGWEIGHLVVEGATPWDDLSMLVEYHEHFDSDFPTQSMWEFVDAGTEGEYWGQIDFVYPGDDGTFLDACYELSSIYDSGLNEEAILTIDLPDSEQIIMQIRHRMFLDPGSRAFLAINDIDGYDPGEEFTIPFPCYFGGLYPYTFTRDTVFSGTIDPGGDNNVAEGWGHFCWTGENPRGFGTVEEPPDEISTFFDLTSYANQTGVQLRFIFRTGDEIIDPFFPFTGTDYSTWRIEEVTIKAL